VGLGEFGSLARVPVFEVIKIKIHVNVKYCTYSIKSSFKGNVGVEEINAIVESRSMIPASLPNPEATSEPQAEPS